jgi:hypothetical protein
VRGNYRRETRRASLQNGQARHGKSDRIFHGVPVVAGHHGCMWSQLSNTSRIAIVQAALIVMMVFVAAGALKVSGRGKHTDPEIVATSESMMHRATFSKWLRDHGWTLMCIPAGTVIFGTIRSRRDPEADSERGWLALGIGSSIALFAMILIAGVEPMTRRHFIYMRVSKPVEQEEKAPAPAE